MKNILKWNVYVEGSWLSTQQWILGMFPHSIASNKLLSAQQSV